MTKQNLSNNWRIFSILAMLFLSMVFQHSVAQTPSMTTSAGKPGSGIKTPADAERSKMPPAYVASKPINTLAMGPLREAIEHKLKTQQKVKLDLFVMSQCPFGVMAEQSIIPTVQQFGSKVELRLNFIAGEEKLDGRIIFNSLHGQSEIDENIRQLIIARDQPNKLQAYLLARANNYTDNDWRPAAAKAGIDAQALAAAVTGADAIELFSSNIKIGQEAGINASPSLLIDGVKYKGQLIDPETSSATACQTGTDPFTGSRYIVCSATPTYAWISANTGGSYHAEYICRSLGYAGIGRYGGTCGYVCGYCTGGTSCTNPQVNTTFDGGGNQGSDAHGIILANTVHWECTGVLTCTAPSFTTCPANITTGTANNACNAVVIYNVVTAGTSSTLTYTFTGQTTGSGSGSGSGSTFNKGVTTVTITATNGCGTATCSFTITVNDTQAPVLTCPSNITVNNDPNMCGAVVNYNVPVATDNCATVVSGTQTFNYTGAVQQFTVPAGVTSINIDAFGAQSGNLSSNYCTQTGAFGGRATGNLAVTPGQTLYIYVGQQGQLTNAANGGYSVNAFNGGGKGWTWNAHYGSASSGGGASDVRIGGTALSNRVIVAGGAGGGTCNGCVGGIGGGVTGGTGGCNGGTGGSQTSGGTGGVPGSFGVGGDANSATTVGWTGGGGGGWYGGAAGYSHVAGGGGSSYTGGVTGGTMNAGVKAGHGQVILTWNGVAGPAVVQTAGLPSGSNFPVGTTTNTFTATDAAGNQSTCSFTVTVNDNQAPVITCPAAVTVSCAANVPPVDVESVFASDNCSEVVAVSHEGDVISNQGCANRYTITRTYKAIDDAGNIATCTQVITVFDNTAPVLTCPAPITVSNAAGQCGANVTFNATATDNCGGTPVITYSPASGSFFNIGTTTVTATATDACGNSSTCTFTVTVNDTEAPVITCPSNITVNATANTCGAVVNYNPPTITENCTSQVSGSQTFSFTGTLTNWTVPAGVTSITINAKGAQGGNSTSQGVLQGGLGAQMQGTFNVTPGQSLTLLVGGRGQSLGNGCSGGGGGGSFVVSSGNLLLAAGGGGGAMTCYYNPSVGGAGKPGQITTNGGASGSGDVNFPNMPATPGGANGNGGPVGSSGYGAGGGGYLTPGQNGVYNAQGGGAYPGTGGAGLAAGGFGGGGAGYPGCCGAAGGGGGYSGGAGGNHGTPGGGGGSFNAGSNQQNVAGINAGNGLITISWNQNSNPVAVQTAGLPSGAVFPVGTTTNTFTATDAAGNISTCSFTVTVIDNQAPTISCPANISVNATGPSGAVVNYATPVGQDNCPAALTVMTAGLASGSTFPIGTTTVTYQVTDGAGLTAQCSFTVTVTGLAPQIVCPANITVNNTQGQCGAVVNFAATETVAIPASTITYSHNPGTFFPVGTTTVTATATNPVGSSSCTFTVTVVDNQAPSINCPGSLIVTCSAEVPLPDITLVGTGDNCPAPVTVTWEGDVVSNQVCANRYTITRMYKATDAAGNTSTCEQVIMVNDDVAPVVSCPSDITLNNDAGQCGAIVTFNATATDNCAGVVTITYSKQPGAFFTVGTTTVTVTATDLCGNTASCSFNVTVIDNEAPTVTCAADIVQSNDEGACGAYVTVPSPVMGDNCGVLSVVNNYTNTSNASGTYPVGVTTILWTVTDIHNNVSTCTQTITINDEEAPVITCPADVTLNCQDDNSSAATGVATATDNCTSGENIVVTQSSVSTQTATGPGHYNYVISRTWRATDLEGNYSECVQTITVRDITAPVAICKPVTITLANGTGSITPADVNNGSYDNCSPVSLSLSQTDFSCLNIGNNTVTLTVTDVSGNSSTCTAVVTVVGELPNCTITAIPGNNIYTGGVPTNLYLGYGPQTLTLQVSAPASGAPYTYSWSGGLLSNYNSANPVFTAATAGSFTYTVLVTNRYGCVTTCSVTICVTDIRVPGSPANNIKVYVCHNGNTISVSTTSVASHIEGHAGDRLGKCDETPCGQSNSFVSTPAEETVPAQEINKTGFRVHVYPNPSAYDFSILVTSKGIEPIVVRILDLNGTVRTVNTVAAKTGSIKVGSNLPGGTYFAEVIQGANKQVIKLVKLN